MAVRKAVASAVTKEGHRPLLAAAESAHKAVAEHLAARKVEASLADSEGGLSKGHAAPLQRLVNFMDRAFFPRAERRVLL